MSTLLSDLISARVRGLGPPPNWAQRAEDDLVAAAREIARLRAELAAVRADAERLAYVFSGANTESDALTKIEMRLLSGDVPAMDEVRAAIDAARGGQQ